MTLTNGGVVAHTEQVSFTVAGSQPADAAVWATDVSPEASLYLTLVQQLQIILEMKAQHTLLVVARLVIQMAQMARLTLQ